MTTLQLFVRPAERLHALLLFIIILPDMKTFHFRVYRNFIVYHCIFKVKIVAVGAVFD